MARSHKQTPSGNRDRQERLEYQEKRNNQKRIDPRDYMEDDEVESKRTRSH